MKKRLQRIRANGRLLDEIMAWKRQEVPRQMAEMTETNLHALAAFTPPALDFAAALAQPGVRLIAEVKRASPDKGLIAKDFSAVAMALDYADGGAAAIACVADARFFQGQLEYLTAIKEAFRRRDMLLPVLHEDFIYHPYQVLQARAAGADAILLLMAVLGDADYHRLLSYARELGMAVVVAVHSEAELARALSAAPRIISINNRDLQTFAIDMTTTDRLRPLIPAGVLTVATGGIRSVADVETVRKSGVDAILAGESLVRQTSDQRKRKVQQLVRTGLER